jgi:hypothetical protein
MSLTPEEWAALRSQMGITAPELLARPRRQLPRRLEQPFLTRAR